MNADEGSAAGSWDMPTFTDGEIRRLSKGDSRGIDTETERESRVEFKSQDLKKFFFNKERMID